MKAINFYSSNYHSQLVGRRKNCTIRWGDKSGKYEEGDIVWVTVGKRLAPKKRIYTAMIDRVDVKPIGELSVDDIHGENPDFSGVQDIKTLLQGLYDRDFGEDDLVSVIYFTEIVE